MATWTEASKTTTDWDDDTGHYRGEFYYNLDINYDTNAYTYNGSYGKENTYYTVGKSTTTWS